MTLDQLGSVSRGRSRHRPRDAEFLYGGPYPFVQTGDVKKAGLYLRDFEQTYSEAGLTQSRLWPAGTLCITIAANIAETSILDMEACFPDSVIGFIAEPKKADARFVKYLFDASLKMRFQSFTQGAAQDNLSQAKLLSIKFPVPELVVQTEIADILSAYDDLIENNRRRITLLEEAARLLYREWFVHFRFPGHEHLKIIDGIPAGWEQVRVADKFDTTSGGTPSRQNPDFFSGSINWVKTQELNERPIFETSEKITEEAIERSSAKLLPDQTLLVSIYGNTNIGRTGSLAVPGSSNQACVALLPKRRKEDWIYAQLWLQKHREQIIGLAQGAAQTNISQETLRGLTMIWPSSRLLDTFLDSVLSSYQQIECLCLQNVKLVQARDLLLPRLMNGEIAV